jgi:hypothetical protein
MKIKLLVTIFFSFSWLFGQAQNTFQKVYTDALGWLHSEDMQQTIDTGFIVCGTTPTLIKIDKYGTPTWGKKYFIDGFYLASYSIIQTNDEGFATSGILGPYNDRNRIFLLKTDADGNYEWSKVYQRITDTLSNIIYNTIQTSDNGYLICGNFYSLSVDYSKAFLIRTDASGNILWTKTYNKSQNFSEFIDIKETSDGGFIIKGTDYSQAYINTNILLIKINENGTPVWSRTISVNESDSLLIRPGQNNFIEITQNTGYILSGLVQEVSTSHYYTYPYLIKTDVNGDLLWNKVYQTIMTDEYTGPTVKNTSDGGLVLSGVIEDSVDTDNIYLIKTDNVGNILWNRTWGNGVDNEKAGYFATQTYDNGFAVLGQNVDFNVGSTYLIKTDSMGNSQCEQLNWTIPIDTKTFWDSLITVQVDSNIFIDTALTLHTMTVFIDTINVCVPSAIESIDIQKNNLIIFPNPFSTLTILQTDKALENAILTLYNAFGQKVKQIINISGQAVIIHRDNLPSGLYYLKLTQDNQTIATDKLVIKDN